MSLRGRSINHLVNERATEGACDDRDRAAGADEVLVAQLRPLLGRSARLAPAASATFVILAWRQVDHGALLAWLGFTFVACLAVALQVIHQRRASCAGTLTAQRAQRHLVATMGLTSGGWGLVAWLVVGRPLDVVALAAVYIVGFLAASIVFNASSRATFLAFAIPMALVSASGFLWDGRRAGVMVACALALFTMIATGMHDLVLRLFRAAVEGEVESRALARRLLAEQEAVAASHARLAHDATHDSLTALANRDRFREVLASALAADASQRASAVLVLDVDRFNVVNDSLGPEAGDQLLIELSRRLQAVLVDGETAARLGGDGFAVVLDKARGARGAHVVADRVLGLCDEPFALSGRSVVVTLTVGVAEADGSATADDLLRRADVAMHRAKADGRNRVVRFEDHMRQLLDRRVDEEIEVRRAVAAGEITAWFQPVVDLTSGAIIGAEALARWAHPTEGILPPPRFLDTALDCGLGPDILTAVTGAAARLLCAIDAARVDLPLDFRVWVNFDPQESVMHRVERLDVLAARLGIAPHRLGVEVTERVVLADLERASQILESVKAMGIKVALDDFGTGHSSLSLLQTLPVDAVKIDRSFISDVVDDRRDHTLVRAILSLADELALETVAEGIETGDQERVLMAAGCRTAQGFRYSPAVATEDFVDLLVNGAPWQHAGPRRLAAGGIGR